MPFPLPKKMKTHPFYKGLYSHLYEPLRFRCKRLFNRGVGTISFIGITGRFSFKTPIELERIEEFSMPWKNETDFLRAYLEACSNAPVIYDIGANIGIFSLLAAIQAPHRALVHAFEPEENNYEALNENVKLNKLSNVIAHKLAIGATSSVERLISPSHERGVGTHRIGRGGEGTVAVQVNSIDNLVADGLIPPPDVVKIDVEGYEFSVLHGMLCTVKSKPMTLFLEFHEKLLEESGKTREHLKSVVEQMGLEITRVLESPIRSEVHFIIGPKIEKAVAG